MLQKIQSSYRAQIAGLRISDMANFWKFNWIRFRFDQLFGIFANIRGVTTRVPPPTCSGTGWRHGSDYYSRVRRQLSLCPLIGDWFGLPEKLIQEYFFRNILSDATFVHIFFRKDTCECVPGVIRTAILNLLGSERISLTRIERPINVAIEQCGMVGVKVMLIVFPSSSTSIKPSWTTLEFFISKVLKRCFENFLISRLFPVHFYDARYTRYVHTLVLQETSGVLDREYLE